MALRRPKGPPGAGVTAGTAHPWRREQGVALVAVLWVVTLLAAIAASFVGTTRSESDLALNQVENAKAEALADAGVQRAILAILQDLEAEEEDFGDADEEAAEEGGLADEAGGFGEQASAGGSLISGLAVDGRPYNWAFNGGVVRLSIQAEGGKIDLNGAPEELLQGLFESAGADPEVAQALAAAVVDFRDSDQERSRAGAEDQDYMAAGLTREAKDAPFTSVAELQQVLGMTRPLYDAVEPALTVYTRSRGIDPETAPPEALRALPQIGPAEVEAVLGARAAGEEDLEAYIASAEPFLTPIISAVYTIRAEARTSGGALFIREAVVSLSAVSDLPYSLLAWRRGRPAVSAPAGS